MTSNLGARDRKRIGLGGLERPQAAAHHYREAAQAFFRPEFVNRIDFLVPFAALDAPAVRGIARRMLDSALKREGFARRGITVRARDEVLDLLMTHGFDPKYGARPMKRAIEQRVLVPLSRRLVLRQSRGEADFDLYVHGGRVAVVDSGGPVGGPCPALAGLAAEHDRLWTDRIAAIRARLDGWAASRLVHDLRAEPGDRTEAGLPDRVVAARAAIADLDPLASAADADGIAARQAAGARMDAVLARLEWDLCRAALLDGAGDGATIELTVDSPTLHPAGRAAAETLVRAYRAWCAGRGLAVQVLEESGGWHLTVDGPDAGLLRLEIGLHRLLPDDAAERAVDVRVRRPDGPAPDAVVREIAGDTLWDPTTEVERPLGLSDLAEALDGFLLARMCRAVEAPE